MKVAHVCLNFPPEFLGGTERVTRALALAQQAAGDDVVVIAGSDLPHDGHDVVVQEVDGIEVLRLCRRPEEVYGLDLRRPRLATVFEDLVLEREVDVVHLHHWSTLSIRMARGARMVGAGVVITLHDLWTSCPRFFRQPPAGITCPTGAGREACVPCAARDLTHVPEAKLRIGYGMRDREMRAELDAAHHVLAPSESCARRVAEHVPFPGTIEVLPHGLLEVPPARPAAPRPAGGPLRIGSFGNLVPDKGVDLLVEACAGLDDVELHLAGPFLDAAHGARLQARAAELGVALVHHGSWDRDDAHPAEGLDLAVFPSLCQETYGLVVEEAFARGVPVVVSDRGALRERVGAAGRVVAVDDVGPLRAVLRELAGDRGALAALAAAVPAPADLRTVDDAVRRYREIHDDAARRARGGA